MIKEELIHLIQQRRANVAVLGLGYVGLPLALTFAKAGFYVIGIDPDEDKIEQLNERQSYITDVSNAELRKQIDSGRFRATSDYSVLSEIDAVSISVPTPLRKTGDPDMSFIAKASQQIAPYLHRGMVILISIIAVCDIECPVAMSVVISANGLISQRLRLTIRQKLLAESLKTVLRWLRHGMGKPWKPLFRSPLLKWQK